MRKEKKYHYIYKTTNLKNGKFYLGMHSTYNLNDGYLGSGTILRRSIRRNGPENFKIEYLEFFDNRTDLANRERELVNEDLLKDPMCMNLKTGGDGGFVSKEHEIKFRAAAKASHPISLGNGRKKMEWLRTNDIVWYEKWQLNKRIGLKGNQSFLGKSHTIETKQKMSQSKKGKGIGDTNSQFGTCWITNGTENKKIKKTDTLPVGWSLGRTIK